MKRGLLLFNPEATSVSPRVRDVIAHALDDVVSLQIEQTEARHHATDIAREAAATGVEIVFVLGGDGTLNEAINGLAGSDATLVPLPGGGTNVLARTLGYPHDPIEATAVVIERLAEKAEPRRVNLGEVNGRRFAFCAGVGFDAQIVHEVERRFQMKKKIGQPYFVYQAFRTFFLKYDRRHPAITIRAGGRVIDDALLAIVCNSDPYTYLGARPFRVCPEAGLDRDLSLLALTKMRTVGALRVVGKAFSSARQGSMRFVESLADLQTIEIECARPLPYQVDGDHAGEGTHFEFRTLHDALSVLSAT